MFIYICRLETILLSNGERFSLLVNEKTGMPDFYSTLWVIVELRNQSAVNTIRNKLGMISSSVMSKCSGVTVKPSATPVLDLRTVPPYERLAPHGN